MLVNKLGGVPAHPANVHRLLDDEQQLVLVFPEGRKGTEKLYKDRYRLRRFGRGGFVEAAMRAKTPIVPIAVLGAEEAMPMFAQIGLLQRLTGLIYFPVTPLFPHLGLLGAAYLPAKFRIRFLEPIPTDQWGEAPWDDKGLVQTVAEEVRARIQDELVDLVVAPAVGLARMTSRRILITGISTLLGRPAGAGARARRRGRGDHRRQPRRPDVRARAHRVRPRRAPARAAAADRARRRDRHRDRHAAGRRLAARARRASPTRRT